MLVRLQDYKKRRKKCSNIYRSSYKRKINKTENKWKIFECTTTTTPIIVVILVDLVFSFRLCRILL